MKMDHVMSKEQNMIREDSITFNLIFILCFLVCFVISLFTQILPAKWDSWLPGAEGKSLIDGTRSAVYSFMSYLN
jgi:light-harvesting complex 1 beta chain